MTSPGGMLRPGDETRPPEYGTPEGAYVSGGSGSSSLTDLNGLDEDGAKARMRAPLEGTFAGMRGGFWGALGQFVQGAVNLVVGTVTAIVDGIHQIANAIGSLFGAAHVDMTAVDAARVAGENAIVAKWGDALDQLDEIQRVGGAFAKWKNPSTIEVTWGEDNPHPLPINEEFPLAQGTQWHAPNQPWGYWGTGTTWPDNDGARGNLARLGGTLELQESGLWMVYFQAALLQGTQRTTTPADLWCYVTNSQYLCPVGTPPESGTMPAYWRDDGGKSTLNVSQIAAYGRAGQYLGVADTRYGGGNTVSGYMLVPLDSAGWFVHLACTGYRHFGGAASTMLFATKVNSESLRDSIEELKTQIAAALPGQSTDLLLDEASIAAMVAEAEGVEAGEVVVPTGPPEAPNG